LKSADLVPPRKLGKPLGITRRRKIESHGEDVSGPEARVYTQEGDEASNEETRAGEPGSETGMSFGLLALGPGDRFADRSPQVTCAASLLVASTRGEGGEA
jgi:hypothetical protein